MAEVFGQHIPTSAGSADPRVSFLLPPAQRKLMKVDRRGARTLESAMQLVLWGGPVSAAAPRHDLQPIS